MDLNVQSVSRGRLINLATRSCSRTAVVSVAFNSTSLSFVTPNCYISSASSSSIVASSSIMEAQLTSLLRRPATAAARSCLSSTSSVLPSRPLQQIRSKSTVNRHKRALGVPPHPSFISSPTVTSTKSEHIIYNPPSSEPNVLHTPFKFLPKSDPRRQANLPALFASTVAAPVNTPLPPMLPFLPGPDKPKQHHLTPKEVSEIRRLRAEDPVVNSVGALSKKFGCSHLFIQMCTSAPREHQEQHKARLAAARERWGPIRAKAREDRARRKQMLLRGEL